ncbi:MAG: hypothetical protein ABI183_16895 [Polyangiaceae bacterium]
MRISLPTSHGFLVDLGTEWVVDEIDPAASEQLGIYIRSVAHGVYLNVRRQSAGQQPLTPDGMLALLREQNWASAPFDEWSATESGLIIIGGTFETVDMNGEVVIEVFITDGKSVANFVAPAERNVARAVTPLVQALAKTVVFEAHETP